MHDIIYNICTSSPGSYPPLVWSPPERRSSLHPFFLSLSFFFPSSFLPSFPFSFLPLPSFQAISTAHHHHRGEGMLCNYCKQVSFVFSMNPYCFCIQSSKLYIYLPLHCYYTSCTSGSVSGCQLAASICFCTVFTHSTQPRYFKPLML